MIIFERILECGHKMGRWDWDFVLNSTDAEGLESTIRKCFASNIVCQKCNRKVVLADMTIRITAIDAPDIKQHRRKTIFVGKV
jgi:hypothetical protein